MPDPTEAIRSIVIPVGGRQLILPNAAVAELINYVPPTPVFGAPEWLAGTVQWRGQRLPVVLFEVLCCQAPVVKPARTSRIVICNTISGRGDLGFVGLVATELPRLIRIDGDAMGVGDGDENEEPGVLRRVEIYGDSAAIPDLYALETMCVEHMNAVEKTESANDDFIQVSA